MVYIKVLTTYDIVGSKVYKIFTPNEEHRFASNYLGSSYNLKPRSGSINLVLNQLPAAKPQSFGGGYLFSSLPTSARVPRRTEAKHQKKREKKVNKLLGQMF